MISAKVVADSENEFSKRITTMVVTFPRILLAEAKTHRILSDDTAIEVSDAGFNDDIALSRNSASSRAIPFNKMIQSIKDNPFIPIAWMKDHRGMQGTEYFTNDEVKELRLVEEWFADRDYAIERAIRRSEAGVTKQIVNRPLETFAYHTCIVTATEWENFFALRCPQYECEGYYAGTFRSKKDAMNAWGGKGDFPQSPDDTLGWLKCNKGQAEIHMMALAEAMHDAYNESKPNKLKSGEWHIPYLTEELTDDAAIGKLDFANPHKYGVKYIETEILNFVKIATARCARVSYTVIGEEDKVPNYENDIKLHDRLLESGHMSPFEHCARSMNRDEYDRSINGFMEQVNHSNNPMAEHFDVGIENYPSEKSKGWSGNFRGFIQYRKMIPGENII